MLFKIATLADAAFFTPPLVLIGLAIPALVSPPMIEIAPRPALIGGMTYALPLPQCEIELPCVDA